MNEMLKNMIRGLSLHYLHKGTIEEAIEQGKSGGVPAELLESLPGMMFEITSAASAIFSRSLVFDEVVDELTGMAFANGKAEDFTRDDAATLVKLTLDFFEELCVDDEFETPLPPATEPRYQYGINKRSTSWSS